MTMNKYTQIKKFLIQNADVIQKRATKEHKKFLGGEKFRSEVIEKYQINHIRIVRELAKHLRAKGSMDGLYHFKKLGDRVGHDAVTDELTLQEAVDGVIFLKQALMSELKENQLLQEFSIDKFYDLNYVIGVYIDVVASRIAFTYHDNYLEKINEVTRRLEEVAKNKDEFIGAATHELKTPVTALKGYTQVLQMRLNKAGDTRSATHLSKMDAQLNRLNTLIGDLLDVTKIESGRLQFHLSKFEIDELIKESVELMQQTTDRHHIVITGLLKKKVYADRDRLNQVLTNLLSNAIKYSPHQGEIIVKTIANVGAAIICVQDFGVGIPKASQKRIFERFYRVSGSKETTFPGLGLGLYIASEIMKRHNGKIWVESEQGKGSTFYVSLPYKNNIRQEVNTFVEEEIKHE